MNESILTSVKKLLGIQDDYTHFDADLIIHINSAFSVLHQLGVGPEEPFKITGDEESWGEFTLDNNKIEMVKSYVGLKCRLIFDPPTIGSHMEAVKEQISELEWRLNAVVDHTPVRTTEYHEEGVNWGD